MTEVRSGMVQEEPCMKKHDWFRGFLMIIVQQGAMVFFMKVAKYQLFESAGLAALVAVAFLLVFNFKRSSRGASRMK